MNEGSGNEIVSLRKVAGVQNSWPVNGNDKSRTTYEGFAVTESKAKTMKRLDSSSKKSLRVQHRSKILFCNIAWMKRYQGATDDDIPVNGGSYVDTYHDANEKYNYWPFSLTTEGVSEDQLMLLGSFETKGTHEGTVRQTHIEKIGGCEAFANSDKVDGVLVVWCATSPNGTSNVVGWYKDASVYRDYQSIPIDEPDGSSWERWYNIVADPKNAVLLPESKRARHIWHAPRHNSKTGTPYGFFRSNVWYGREEKAQEFIDRLIANIDSYDGENILQSIE